MSKINDAIIILVILLVPIFLYLVILNPVLAADQKEDSSVPNKTVSLPDPLGMNEQSDPRVLIGRIINAVLGIVGSLALAMFIYGGFIWMTSTGNAEQVTKGKNILIWATIGLVIIFSAYALVNFVIFKALLGVS